MNCGHRVVNCKVNLSYRKLGSRRRFQQRKGKPRYKIYFAPLNDQVKCFKCKNFEHIEVNCNLKGKKTGPVIEKIEQKPKIWKEKEKSEQCDFSLYARNGKSHWYVDSGVPCTCQEIKEIF